jgi:DNA polymerase zeta
MATPAATEWRGSEVEEFQSHVLNGTFGPACDIPKGQYAVPLDWVYKLKRCGRYKVRVVIRGYLMRAGLHFNQTFSPTPQARSVRAIMALAAKHGYALTLHDVKTAFLTAELDTVLYVRLPPAFNDDLAPQAQAEPSATVHLCRKAIPGCPQGSRLWNRKVDSILTSLGFTPLPDDVCFYVYRGADSKHPVFLLVWVDDFICCGHPGDAAFRASVFDALRAVCPGGVVDLGEVQPQDILGLSILRTSPHRLIIHQAAFVKAVLHINLALRHLYIGR